MNENMFPQLQQVWSFWEKAAKDATAGQAAAVSSAIDSSVAMTKMSLSYATQVAEQWGKLTSEATRRFTNAKIDADV